VFSIVIPCYNDVDLLRKTLAGLCVNLGAAKFEVILVDNNSFDENIDEAYRAYVSRLDLTLLRQPRLPHPKATSRARNLGLAIGRGEWVVNLDADCVPMPGYMARLAEFIESRRGENPLVAGLRRFVDLSAHTEEDILAGRVEYDSLPLVASPSNYFRTIDRRLPQIEHLERSEQPWAYFHSCNIAYRRDEALSAGGFDECYDGCWGYEDIDFAHRMITMRNATPRYLPGIELLHQDSERSSRQNRFDKTANRNWSIITARIPGYEAYKTRQYKTVNEDIRL
jgi:glycosyltransferase involved in cell wall biosynthesis